jgi:hypothetical protein
MPTNNWRANELIRKGKALRAGRLNLTGQRFGRLVVLRPSSNSKQFTRWLCKCDCGKRRVVRTSQLRNGHTKSCGCFRTDVAAARFTTHGLTVGGKLSKEYHLYHSAKKRAREQCCPFDIELTDIVIPERCPVFPEIVLECGKGIVTNASPTLDKLIPSLGYVKGNIRVISHKANTIKQNASVEELRRVAEWLEWELSST